MSLPPGLALLAGACLLALNAATYLLFALDKRRARERGWRIPERTLLAFALAGGSLGAVAGQRLLRHKTRKQPFRSFLLGIVLLHAALLVLLAVPAVRGTAGSALAAAAGWR